jgi:hypothetical protein
MVTPLVNDGDLRSEDGLIAEGNGGPQLANAMTCDGIKSTVLRRSLIPTIQLMAREAADLFPRAMVVVDGRSSGWSRVVRHLASLLVTYWAFYSTSLERIYRGILSTFTVLINRNASDGTRPIDYRRPRLQRQSSVAIE